MSSDAPTHYDVAAAVRDFAARIGALGTGDDRSVIARLDVDTGADRATVELTPEVARALVDALVGYHDPRDVGSCEHCRGRRLDANLMCLDCQRPNGIFGELLMERFARYDGPTDSR